MKRVKPIVVLGVLFVAAIIFIPSILVLPFSAGNSSGNGSAEPDEEKDDLKKLLEEASPIDVSVYRAEKDTVETVPLEEYVAGVVGAEMPAEFEEEALKAQSLMARTYIVKQLMQDKQVGILKGADVSDTETHQVYKNEDDLRKIWGPDFHKNMNKIRQAVYETRGQIIVYNDEPIDASYFSTSNGYTEDAGNYWTKPVPYLKSVASPWDTESPRFSGTISIPVKEFEKKLGVKITGDHIGEIVSRTGSNRVEKVKIGNKEFSGREIREALGLRSTDFTWEKKGNEIVITTKGYGHGIGMSQYGANGMAKEGKTFEDIIRYYYKDVEIQEAAAFLDSYIAKK